MYSEDRMGNRKFNYFFILITLLLAYSNNNVFLTFKWTIFIGRPLKIASIKRRADLYIFFPFKVVVHK